VRRCVSTPAVWEGWAARSIPHDCVALEEGSGAGAVLAPRSEEEEVAATVACWALQRAGAGEGRGTLCGSGAVAVGRPSYALFGNRPVRPWWGWRGGRAARGGRGQSSPAGPVCCEGCGC